MIRRGSKELGCELYHGSVWSLHVSWWLPTGSLNKQAKRLVMVWQLMWPMMKSCPLSLLVERSCLSDAGLP